MTGASPKLSNTARNVLTLAAARHDHLVRVPQLPVAAARQVIRSLLNAGLVEELGAPIEDAGLAWRTAEDGAALMLRATATGLAAVSEPTSTDAHPSGFESDAPKETLVHVIPDRESLANVSAPVDPVPNQSPASIAVSDARRPERNEDAPSVSIQVDAHIAPLVHAFIIELMMTERASHVATFLRRLERGTTERGAGSTGTGRAREMSVSQRKIVDLCTRPEGATGKELAEGCGWPSIAARCTRAPRRTGAGSVSA